MSRRNLIIYALAAAIASAPLAAAGPTQAAQSSSVAGVKITVEPKGFPRDAKTWDFASGTRPSAGSRRRPTSHSASVSRCGESLFGKSVSGRAASC